MPLFKNFMFSIDSNSLLVHLFCRIKWGQMYLNKTYLHVILDEASSFNSGLHVKTDVHFDLGFLIGQFNNWYLYKKKPKDSFIKSPVREILPITNDEGWPDGGHGHGCVCVSHRSFVKYFDREWLGHVILPEGLLQLLQGGSVPLPKHHQVNVTARCTTTNPDESFHIRYMNKILDKMSSLLCKTAHSL